MDLLLFIVTIYEAAPFCDGALVWVQATDDTQPSLTHH